MWLDWETKRVSSISNNFESQSPCLIDVGRLIYTCVREIPVISDSSVAYCG